MPAKIIFNIDESDDFEFDNIGKQCIKPFLKDITILKKHEMTNCDTHFMEHCLIEGAFRHVDKNQSVYDDIGFVITIRTDIFVSVDIPSSIVYGENSLFWRRFLLYEDALKENYQLKFNRLPTYHETLWAYVFTGGISKFITKMIMTNITSNGCENWMCQDVLQRNTNLKEFIYNNIDDKRELYINRPGSFHIYRDVMINDLRNISQHFQLFYLIGASWVHWGKFHQFRMLSRHGDNDYGKMEWNTTEILKNNWRDVVESNMRLIHMKYDYNLVDFLIDHDLKKSFHQNDQTSLLENYVNSESVAYIARPCEKHYLLDEC